ncbi:GTPase [Schlesneria paludicola]|uniref:GTPase n=1 Tax=Schlesneria paludicola TaxID=360056 RepID=UPI00029A71BC|nr:GTPase [Schlesneria paludicola]
MTDALPADAPLASPHDESTQLASFAALTRQLGAALVELEQRASALRIKPLAGRDWYDLLVRKLLPQLTEDAYLIVAVVGGTNIGKSVVFNHIAGFRASASSPLASGTKHPVCLVPTGFDVHHDLQKLFPAFELRPWVSSEEALASHDEHCLFWRTNDEVPQNLVILDTPDVDSDAPVNWHRADAVRQAADVLVAVLTQQKYNDAAVKQFFRKAAVEDKAALIVFNQVELPDDEPYWPRWLETFCGETGLKPEFVYLAQNDRKAAEAIRLRFDERTWPLTSKTNETVNSATKTDTTRPVGSADRNENPLQPIEPVQLKSVLSHLRFSEIKLRTLRGSLRQLVSETDGAPAYLREIWIRSQQFRDAGNVFAARGLIRQADWPAAPNSLLVNEMWAWWDVHREVWTSNIHGFYSHVGRWVNGGVRLVRNRIWGEQANPLDEYRQAEWDAIVRVLQQVYDQLRMVTTLGNELLTDRLEQLLAGTTCESVLAQLHREHDAFDFEQLARTLVNTEMTALKQDRQQLFEILRNADRAAAVARPLLTFLLALGGGLGAEDVLINAGSQWVTHVAVDATAAAGTSAAGEAVVGSATNVLGQTKAWLLQLHVKFKNQREAWLIEKLRQHLLGELLSDLQQGETIPQSPAFDEAKKRIRQLNEQLGSSTD